MSIFKALKQHISKIIKYALNRDGHIMAPPVTWKTSAIGSYLRYLKESILDLIKPNKVGKEFEEIMCSNPTAEDAKRACDIFEKETGIKMLMTHPGYARSFASNARILIHDVERRDFPKDVKYVVIGHGDGTVLNDTWHVLYEPETKIFDFIDKNIPKGELAIVNCCEVTPNELKHLIPKDKPAIGKVAGEFRDSYHHLAKVVRSGSHEIIGAYGNGIMTMYK